MGHAGGALSSSLSYHECPRIRIGVGCMSGDAGACPECEVKTPYHTTFLECSSGYDRVTVGLSSCEVL